MRGKGLPVVVSLPLVGITPAHAGKRTSGGTLWACSAGSPPHMRGKVACFSSCSYGVGITPAHAGKSDPGKQAHLVVQDHPRTCGEKFKKLLIGRSFEGSPPHMRGKALCRPARKKSIRITPAHAGKRLKRSRSTVPHAAIVPLFPSVCNKPAGSDGSPAGHDAPPFLPIENAAPASPAYNLRSL